MITQLHIRNFRSIKSSDLKLGKITVLTGANNSGKSSFIYALLVLKNIIDNPNQSIDNFLTLPFINLGGFEQTVFDKSIDTDIVLGISIKDNECEVEYNIGLNPGKSNISLSFLKPFVQEYNIDVSFPYSLNKYSQFNLSIDGKKKSIAWNGFLASMQDAEPDLLKALIPFQLPVNRFYGVDFVPIRRGFTKPYFGTIPLQSQISSEEEIATLLALDKELSNKVAYYLQKIVDRAFYVYITPGTANFYLRTIDKKTGFISELVNEGLGTNQLVTILAKVLQSKNKFVCIDEPEIHLHPSIIDKLVSVMVEIAEKEDKQFLVSTHSEHFISALLNKVAENEINNEDINVYYLTKDGMNTKVEEQAVNENGQIEGGLKNFYADELDNLKTLFKITG
jgi:energy-coupling factor transporter ATP-binding protein EcfA2